MTLKQLFAVSSLALAVSCAGAAAQAPEEIRLGVLLPTSGAAAKSGQETATISTFHSPRPSACPAKAAPRSSSFLKITLARPNAAHQSPSA